jgi:hypothetical protein
LTLDEKILILYPELEINKLSVYKDMGIDVIRNYLNTKESNEAILQKYENALLQLIGNKVQSDTTNGIKSYSMSKTSITYGEDKGFRITDDIKSLLPTPYVKLMG